MSPHDRGNTQTLPLFDTKKKGDGGLDASGMVWCFTTCPVSKFQAERLQSAREKTTMKRLCGEKQIAEAADA